ncbi:hypothetical protein XELAEV_18028959mg [Xenopus laevis]|uniref:Uncharacterized protein n=1 Tax=Xenopus laevis TaxID=8355 RepID=A0A974CS56_XENLA|nr:hypothetical protein XELAEV_18028959mg [Xenopus laevis]
MQISRAVVQSGPTSLSSGGTTTRARTPSGPPGSPCATEIRAVRRGHSCASRTRARPPLVTVLSFRLQKVCKNVLCALALKHVENLANKILLCMCVCVSVCGGGSCPMVLPFYVLSPALSFSVVFITFPDFPIPIL